MENRKVLLSIRDLVVKFRVRGRILTAIRGISLDIYENESIAIVGESGSGKSVFTKTFAGMLDKNGFIDQGSVIFNDPELTDVSAVLDEGARLRIDSIAALLDRHANLANGAEVYKRILALEAEKKARGSISDAEDEAFMGRLKDLNYKRTEAMNLRQTFDPRKEKDKIRAKQAEIDALGNEIKAVETERETLIKSRANALKSDTAYKSSFDTRMSELKAEYEKACAAEPTAKQKEVDRDFAREVYLSLDQLPSRKKVRIMKKITENAAEAMKLGVDLSVDENRDSLYPEGVRRCRVTSEEANALRGMRINDMARIKDDREWSEIRGKKIATVFQDPMTSLNPIITIGKQISSVIMKHQNVSAAEARLRAYDMMKKVGIPNAENRYDDYPFQYSGGMRQRIVIAIALSCQPKILICDEPTTALDVTIQAQILKLLKDLQRELSYTIVFITHDLGVVANIADRVAVLYAGQIIELGTAEDVFYDPRHPYTWALLSSLPQLAQRDTALYSIAGTPPSLYNKIVGDAFAPRNPYAMKIDTILEPPMFKVTDTHYARTWLLAEDAPKVEKPQIIWNTHEKLKEEFNI